MQTNTRGMIQNSKLADSSSKIIFEDNVLCSQFLRDYIDLPYFKDIQPEDIEDVSVKDESFDTGNRRVGWEG